MNKLVFATILAFAIIGLGMQSVSAYYSDYGHERYIKDSYDYNGHTYTERSISRNPWGETITYKKVVDYRPTYNAYGNRAYDYWKYGNSRPYYSYRDTYPIYYQNSNYPYYDSGNYWGWQYQ